jgi:predicted nucleotidyltransferase component of viral defense system
MRKDFLNEVAKNNRIKQTDLMEKDLILYQILTDLVHNDFFFKNFLFKGGICLTKYCLYSKNSLLAFTQRLKI